MFRRSRRPAHPTTHPTTDSSCSARVGIAGTILRRVDYEVERDLADVVRPWRDVYIDLRARRSLAIRGGQFKVPFGLDQLTGAMDLDFAYRSLAGTYLTPGRDLGVMAHGRVFDDTVKYQAGLFRQGGDNVRASERADTRSSRTVAGRVTAKPWSGAKAGSKLRSLVVGLAFVDGRLPEGLHSLRGKTVTGSALATPFYMAGRRQRLGAELQWRQGPAAVQGEFIRARDQRRGQGLDNEDLPSAVADGWYLSGTWIVTGERKKDTVRPGNPILSGGVGAVELAARVERFAFGRDSWSGESFLSPRDASIARKGDTVWTTGVNWYPSDYVRLQANVIRERYDAGPLVTHGQTAVWSHTFRAQFGF